MDEPKKRWRPKLPHLTIGTGAGAATWLWLDPETVKALFAQAWQTDVARMTLCFTIAAWLHKSWVRKDMDAQFDKVTDAINNVGDVLGKRIDNIEQRMGKIESKVEKIEFPNRGVL